MKPWNWFGIGMAELVLYLIVIGSVCPAQNGMQILVGLGATALWIVAGCWTFDKQLAAEQCALCIKS